MEILPYVEGWQPGAPVCTAEQFDAILAAAGKGAALPGFGHTAYFLAQSATDPAEKGRRWKAILNTRLFYSGADNDPEMEQAIAKSHNDILSITAGEMRQDALEEMRAIVPQTAEETPAEVDALSMSSISTKSVDWAVPYLLPRGEISVLGGDGGVGKGIWTAQLIAHVSIVNTVTHRQTATSWPGTPGSTLTATSTQRTQITDYAVKSAVRNKIRAISIRYSAQFLEQVKGVEPSSSAWKADVLAVVRHLRGITYYNRAGEGCQPFFILPVQIPPRWRHRGRGSAD